MKQKSSQSSKQKALAKGVPEAFSKLINTRKETDEYVCKLAAKANVALIGFIAPYVGVRISPVEEITASIRLQDEFGIEVLIKEIREAGVQKVYLLINSPGGVMSCSYKIARAIRMSVKEITTFIPHVAASGGTLLALTGNQIVMGPMSYITPLDVQVSYKGTRISADTSVRFFQRASQWFAKVTPDEAPYPWRALTDKLDPFLMEEWTGTMQAAQDYVEEILHLAGYKDSKNIARDLVSSFPTHSYVITPEKAKNIGLNIKDASEFGETWDIMRYWLSNYALEEQSTHIIPYVLPPTDSDMTNTGSLAKQTTKKETVKDEKK